MKTRTLRHSFVKFIPEPLEEGVLYISIDYCTAIHNCVCGCGNKVVTPISPTGWELTFNGDTVSLSPSIGNWSFGCQSHYWIRRSAIHWSGQWSKEEIDAGRERDHLEKLHYFDNVPPIHADKEIAVVANQAATEGFWEKFITKLMWWKK